MIRFQIGDKVVVTGLPNSEWQDSAGVVVKTYERSAADGGVQECAVQFSFARRWFLSSHLTRVLPDPARRFFRDESTLSAVGKLNSGFPAAKPAA